MLVERNERLVDGTWNERDQSSARLKLFAFLKNSGDYVPEFLYQQLPTDGLFMEKALLLGKMEQHQLALTVYALTVLIRLSWGS